MSILALFSVSFLLFSASHSSALTTVPTKMNFQGRLTDASGNIKPNGTYNMRLKFYTVSTAGTSVWSEDRLVSATQGVTVTNGLFSIKLGDITALPASLFASGDLYLEVELPTPATATSASPVWTEGPMTPRNQMATSAYAYNAETLDGIDSVAFGQKAQNNSWTGTNTFSVQSAAAFQVQNSSAVNVFKVDTVNQRVSVGASNSTARLGVEGAGGLVWTSRAAAEANDWNGVTYGNGLYVAVSTMGTNQVMTSPDGITWTARATPANGWIAVTYGNGLFVAVSYIGSGNQVMTSPDGITWTSRTTPAGANRWWSVTYGNGLFVAVSEDGTNRVMTSPDGITWTARTAAEANQWQGVTYGNGLFVAVAATGTNRVMTSPDGITWTARSASEAAQYRSVTYGNGQFVAVNDNGVNPTMTSPDGITWTGRAAPANAGWNNWHEITYGNGQFVAVANGGMDQVMTSPDGITWTAGSVPEANSWQGVTYGNELFVAVSYDGTNRVMTSRDIAVSARGTVQLTGSVTANGSFGVKDITGTVSILSVDTSASTVRVGPATVDANAVVLILDTKNTAGDPVGTNGATYYNSNSGKFRCYEAGAWKDCDTSGFASGTTAQRPSSPSEGLQFFDTTTKQLLVYANGKWQGDRSSNTKIVAMGAPTGCSGSTPVASQNFDSADYVVTSCTSAQTKIQEAITALGSQGGTVYLMEGTYIVDGSITLNANTKLVGAGIGTIMKVRNAFNANLNVLVNATNAAGLAIENIVFDGNKTNNTSGNISALYVYGGGSASQPSLNISNVTFREFRTKGIDLWTTSYVTISNSHFYANAEGIYGYANNQLIINNNHFANQTGPGITNDSSTNSNINGNMFISNNRGIVNDSSGTTINGNTVRSSTSTGIFLGSNVTNNTVTGNTVIGGGATGIAINTNGSHNLVAGNTVTSQAGIGISLGISASNNNVNSNRLRDNGGTGSSSHIEINGSYNLVTDNQITDTAGTGYAISIIASGATPIQNTLSNNTFSGTGASSISDVGTTTIYNNQMDGSGNIVNRGTNGFAVGALSASSTLTVQGGYVGQALSSPAQPTGATQGTAGTTSYSYVVTALDGVGETLPSTTRTITTGNATLNGTNFNRITWVRVSGAVQYKVYRTASAGTPATTGLIGTISANAALQLDDTGLTSSSAAPTSNTTGGINVAGNLQGNSATLSGNLIAGGGLDFVSYAPFARFSSDRIALGSNGNTYAGIDFTVRLDAAITAERSGYTFTRFGPTNLGGNITNQRMTVFNAPSYSGAFTITNAATVAITGAATTASGAVITNNYSLWTQGGTVRMDTGAAGNRGLIIQGAVSQTGDLLQAQDSTGAVLSRIDASGNLVVSSTGDSSFAGKLGIGTTAPASALDVYGTPTGTTYQLSVRDATDMAAGVGGGMTLWGKATTAGGYGRMGGIKGVKENATTGDYQAALTFLTPTNAANDALTERMRISSNGNVGIGTATPQGSLDLGAGTSGRSIVWGGETGVNHYSSIGSSFSSASLGLLHGLKFSTTADQYLYSYGTIARAGIRIGSATNGDISFFNAPSSAQTVGGVFDQGANTKLIIKDSGNVCISLATCSNRLGVSGNIAATGTITGGIGSPDYAENITTSDLSIEAADVVSLDPQNKERVVKSSQPYQTTAIGVISTNPGFLTNATSEAVASGPDQRPLALSGRVPVKVTAENGPIQLGDYLTSSSVPGHAMKATRAGQVIGRAMESFNGDTGKVLMFIDNSYYTPSISDKLQATSLAATTLQISGLTNLAELNVSGLANIGSLVVSGGATIQGSLKVVDTIETVTLRVNGHIVSGGKVPTLIGVDDTCIEAAIEGNDVAGSISLTTKANCQPKGKIITVTFVKEYAKAPRVVLSPSNDKAATSEYYKGATTKADFELHVASPLLAGTHYVYDYVIIE